MTLFRFIVFIIPFLKVDKALIHCRLHALVVFWQYVITTESLLGGVLSSTLSVI